MGIPLQLAYLLLKEADVRPFSGGILQLGRQKCLFTPQELRRMADTQGLRLYGEHLNSSELDDMQFFRSTGFSEVASCDVNSYEHPTFTLDLNARPAHALPQYDVVFDGGTLEHVFHLPHALSNLHRLTKTGGRIIHFAACSNNVDHGFYMFSPTLFADHYTANGYMIRNITICEVVISHNFQFLKPWNLYHYEPGGLDRLMHGGFAAKTYFLFVVVTKTDESSEDKVPQQRLYAAQIWRPAHQAGSLTKKTVVIRIKNVVRDNLPRFYTWLMDIYARVFRRIPNFIGRIPPKAKGVTGES
jgi:hypothetical protein